MSQLVGKNSHDRWYPNSIKSLKQYLITCDSLNNEYKTELVSNLAYSFQYLEYLSKTLRELNLSSVLVNQTIKSFIVFSAALIEALIIEICELNNNVRFEIAIKVYKEKGFSEYIDTDFDELDKIRKLRNRVHLHKATISGKSDYKNFWLNDYKESKRLLLKLISSNHFSGKTSDLFSFLE